MMDKRGVCALVCATALLAGPASAQTPPADAKPDSDATWLVIGIQPSNMRMEIDELAPIGDRWRFHYAISLAAHYPVDGFIVVKVKPGATYGIGAASFMHGGIFGIRYQPCDSAPAFQAEAGKVLYFTSVSYARAGEENGSDRLFETATYSQDAEGARAFLKTHYPGLSDSMERGQCRVVPLFARSCHPHGFLGALANPSDLESAPPSEC